MKNCFFAFMLLAIGAPIHSQEPVFRLKVSGTLADKLAPDTQLRFWYPSSDTSNWTECNLGDLPVSLPFEKLHGHAWHLDFVSKDAESFFSVTLSRDLFDTPRLINVKLDAPTPHIRPIFGFARDVRYTAGITQRMRYRELPQWDRQQRSLTRAKQPEMTIESLQDGAVIFDGKMVDGCMASKWFAIIDQEAELVDGVTYRMTVVYDSGGIFPPIKTTRDFTYRVALHGR